MMTSHDEPHRHPGDSPFSRHDGRSGAAVLGVLVFGVSLIFADQFIAFRKGGAALSIVVIGAVIGFAIWWRNFRFSRPQPTPFLPETAGSAIVTGLIIVYMGLSLSLVFLSNARGAVTWPGRYFALLPLLLAVGIAVFLIVRAQRIQKNRPSPNDCQRC